MSIDTPARIAIIGAGPIGLEAALYARYLGYEVDVYERGRVAEHVHRWGHVQMFTPFGQNCSPLGIAALQAQDPAWQPPAADAHLTGREFIDRYLLPLSKSDLIVDGLHDHATVRLVGREGPLKQELAGSDERIDTDFRLFVETTDAAGHVHERFAQADAVIDTSGTFGTHNWLGAGGLPATGECAAAAYIEYGLPDVLGAEYSRYASRNTLLVGDGDSAVTTLVALAKLAASAPDTWITWVTRSPEETDQPGPIAIRDDEPLPARARLARQANQLAADDANHVTHLGGTTVESIARHADLERFIVRLSGQQPLEFDRVVANVGYRGETGLYEELQVDQCGTSGAPQLIDPYGICTTEPDFYVLGAKSRGRDSRFLLSDGFDQIRRLFALIGDRAELDLYSSFVGQGPRP